MIDTTNEKGYNMNERFKELATQAGVLTDWGSDITVGRYSIGGTLEDMERFAKLIISQCIDEIETYRIPAGNSAAGELACEWTYDALETIRDNIKEHFGIEE